MNELDVRPIRGKAPGDQYSQSLDEKLRQAGTAVATTKAHPLDSDEARREHRQLLSWYYLERERQSANRLDMAMDADMYDNLQWDPEDAQIVKDRGQMPLVYNEVAPMCDWIIGTERRTRVDWRVLPRSEDDVQMADIKTKVLKYISDINRVQFNRSRAFADAVKSGVGWLDDGVRDDPTQDILYSKYEDWRNVLWDSMSYELDLSDARYLFRWRWVDVDIAVLMFPDRENEIRQAAEDTAYTTDNNEEEDTWVTGLDANSKDRSGTLRAMGSGLAIDAHRPRVKLIEGQYRKPARVKVVSDGSFRGSILGPRDHMLGDAVAREGATIVDKVLMRTHVAVFTETHMLALNPSINRHNRFSLTPVWCYRRGRDRLPYGVIRRVRDVQIDLNKRASKALFLLNSNQIIADEGAVADWNIARDEADRPDGLIIKKPGKEFVIRRDTDGATGQIQMMTLDGQSIQKSAGVAQENMGRQTNAVSGEAIKARQLQGSVVTTEPFDNLRFATQVQGEKQLSLSEQWYTDAKVIRLTGTKGALEWIKINQPEQMPDGSVRFLNDITASQADFQVAEQDYSGTLRQVMFDSLNNMAVKYPPEIALRMMTIAMEFSDLPNKDEIAEQIRKLTGERDPNKEPTPEEALQIEQQMQQQAEALQMQRESAITALEEQRAKVREINAKAAKMESEAMAAGMADSSGGMPAEMEQALRQVQEQAATQIESLSAQLSKAQSELANRTLQINRDADVKHELANIDRDTKLRVAEIHAASDKRVQALEKRIEDMQRVLEEKIAAEAAKKADPAPAPLAPAPAPAPVAAPPAAPITLNVTVDAKSGEVKKTIELKHDENGKVTGADVVESPATGEGKKA